MFRIMVLISDMPSISSGEHNPCVEAVTRIVKLRSEILVRIYGNTKIPRTGAQDRIEQILEILLQVRFDGRSKRSICCIRLWLHSQLEQGI